MAGIQAISSSISFSASPAGAAPVAGSSASGASEGLAALVGNGPLQQQIAGIQSLVGDSNSINALAALALMLLLSKSQESEDKNDPWKMLASLALLQGLGGTNSFQMTTNITLGTDAGAAYAASAPGAVAAGSLNVQG